MPANVTAPAEWAEIRKASEMGVTDEAICDDFGVTGAALRKRRSREGWMTKKRLEELAEIQRVKESFKRVPNGGLSRTSREAEKSVSEQLATNGELGSLHASNALTKLLQRVEDGKVALDDLRTAQDVVVALKGARLAAGMDRQTGPNVSVNLAMFGGSGQDSAGWSVSTSEES